jgi:hypothetical protein
MVPFMGTLRQQATLAAVWAATALLCVAQAQQRTRLIMTDGSYQWVLHYDVKGSVVRFASAERNGDIEEVPLAQVNIPATRQWAHDHAAQKETPQRPVLSPELAKEEAARAARTPEISPGLRLPEELSLVVLDQYKDQPELVPLEQKGSGLNPETGHDVLKQPINPASLAHDIYDLRGPASDVRIHTFTPIFYVRIGVDDEGDAGGSAIVVDTHGASGRPTPIGGAASSSYVLEKLKTRSDTREVDSFRIEWLDERKQPDVIEMDSMTLPGSKWVKLTPTAPLERGEYALVEVLGRDALNLDVWDFGVQPDAGDSMEAIRPEAQKPIELERRKPE